MRIFVELCVFTLFISCVFTASVTVSNTALPVDSSGNLLITGELNVLAHDGSYYFYMNNWGGCAGVDCCATSSGCATCCFNPPTVTYPDACVYTNNHSVVVYRTNDFVKWDYLGMQRGYVTDRVLMADLTIYLICDWVRRSERLTDLTVSCLDLTYHTPTKLFIMWYEDRWTGQKGYAVAGSPTPQGPFKTISNTVVLAGTGRVGDFDLFVDDDGTAYHVRTGVIIEKLNANYTAGTGQIYSMTANNSNVEGPVLFKRNGIYYLLVGKDCCACIGGANVVVYMATSPLGPYKLQGDIGTNSTQPFDKHSITNYVTHSQQSTVFQVPDGNGGIQYVWIGNQWVTATQPGHPRNHDLLYWSVLKFDAQVKKGVKQIWKSTTMRVCHGVSKSTLVSLAVWFCASVAIVLLNKFVFQMMAFSYPITLTAVHMVVCALGAIFSIYVFKIFPAYHQKLTWNDQLKKILPLSIVFCANVTLGNVSLRWVPVSFMQILKSTVPAFTVFLQLVVLKKQFTKATYCALIPIVGGVILASWAEVNFNTIGFITGILSSIFTACQAILTGILTKQVEPMNLCLYMVTWSFFILLPLSGGLEIMDIKNNWTHSQDPVAYVLLIVSGLVGFTLNIGTFFVIKYTSPLTFTMAGNFKVVVTIIISVLIFQNKISVLNGVGCGIAIAGVIWYNQIRYLQNMKEKKLQAQKAAEAKIELEKQNNESVKTDNSDVKTEPGTTKINITGYQGDDVAEESKIETDDVKTDEHSSDENLENSGVVVVPTMGQSTEILIEKPE